MEIHIEKNILKILISSQSCVHSGWHPDIFLKNNIGLQPEITILPV